MKYIFLTFILISGSAFATQTYECLFTNVSNPEGNHKETFKLTFMIDEKTKKSYMIGNNGSSKVAHIDKGNGISFVEITGLGNVMTTTIDSNMKAVHSRNTVGILGELLPSQFYGSCVVK